MNNDYNNINIRSFNNRMTMNITSDKKEKENDKKKSSISLLKPYENNFTKQSKKDNKGKESESYLFIEDFYGGHRIKERDREETKRNLEEEKGENKEENVNENYKKKDKEYIKEDTKRNLREIGENKEENENENYTKEDKEYIEEEKESKKESNLKYIIYIIFLILAIIFLIFIIIYFNIQLNNKNKNLDNINKNKCQDGYFLPSDGDQCQKCSIENCGKCLGTKTRNFCIFCLSGFNTVYDNDIIVSCHDGSIEENCSSFDANGNKCINCKEGYFLAYINENEQKCQKCDIENCEKCFGAKLSYICSTCKNGYYIPNDDSAKQSCKECSIKNCKKCLGSKLVNYCFACRENYNPIKVNDVITKCEGCESGENEKCLTCDPSTGQCISCNIGYYLPTDDTIKEKCQKCSVENCKSCSGTRAINICNACIDNYFIKDGGRCEKIS